ncbi:MAG: hypothetical protein LJE94_03955 [Deltaproteobacteria bacterium]|jgi:adenine deaminase|nr:hypothetical protein [Deltaproteobacteria bacterium]
MKRAEPHVHIEGTLEPERMMQLAAKNGIAIPFESIADTRNAFQASFLDPVEKRKYPSEVDGFVSSIM